MAQGEARASPCFAVGSRAVRLLGAGVWLGIGCSLGSFACEQHADLGRNLEDAGDAEIDAAPDAPDAPATSDSDASDAVPRCATVCERLEQCALAEPEEAMLCLRDCQRWDSSTLDCVRGATCAAIESCLPAPP